MSSLDTGLTRTIKGNERVLVDITSASGASSASASAAAAAATAALDRNDGETATKLLVGPNTSEAGEKRLSAVARSTCTESDGTRGSGESEEVENENPLLMSDISRMMETMHSKNLMLKKLVRMQQSRLELLKAENEELRRDGKRKDARLRNADVTIQYLQTEMEEHRSIAHKKKSNNVTVQDESKMGGKSNNKQLGGGLNGESGEVCQDSLNTLSMRRTSMASGRKRNVRMSARWVLERMVRRIKTMKNNTKGVTLCLCTLGGAILLGSLLQTINRNKGCSES